ncbi:protein adenylyltransferase SelO [Pontiella agarivorans]|uniref:Protein nucleotidyltransferase YdiU n=1 Tax=Pontiella agarivorans TaxID=3038953 RepID=A0ABU5N215_9BACT|nr:YdiU family protein [Pontiella agarivorans]MDZ8120490.1 YdiU family protein [Pontiella agarivorans]
MPNPIPFDNTYARLPERFYVKQNAAAVPSPVLLRANAELAEELGIDPAWLETPEALNVFSGNGTAEGSEPLAQAYAGHQFGGFSPQLGDGRALLLGEVIDQNGGRRDIQLKGSGRTPFSRGGDGKSALGPVLREYIVSEAMHALGVPTTRALAAVATGESVLRQEGPEPGGIFTRVASSHIRVGTFQYFYGRNDEEALRELADYTIARHYPDAADAEDPYLSLLEHVIAAQAKLIPHWMSLGFIHGVMNTDNTAISGETIDYGPCAFMDDFHPQCVFSSIDRDRRYAWGSQPDMARWNLNRFAETLLSLISGDSEAALEKAKHALDAFAGIFRKEYDNRFRAKFGLTADAPLDVVRSGFSLLTKQQIDFTLFFRHLTSGNHDALHGLFSDPAPFDAWYASWNAATKSNPDIEAMKKANPILIPRNHRIEQAIQAAYQNDFAPFHQLVDALAKPYEDRAEYAAYERAPKPDEIVHQTFCGT